MHKWATRFFLTMLLISTSIVLFMLDYMMLGMAVILSIFYVWFLSFGRVKDRVRNSLPVFAIILYLFIGISYGWWQEGTYIFFALPFLSLMLKPKRNFIKYMTMALSIGLFVYGVWLGQSIPFYTRLIFIVMIYILFFPPYLFFRFERFAKNMTSKV